MDNNTQTSYMQSMYVSMRQIHFRIQRTGNVFILKTVFQGEPMTQILNLAEVPSLDFGDALIGTFFDEHLCADPRYVRMLDNALIGVKRRCRNYELEKDNFIYELMDTFCLLEGIESFEEAITHSIECTFMRDWILTQSGKKGITFPNPASRPLSARQLRRAMREVIQREAAERKRKADLKSHRSKDTEKARSIKRRRERDEIQKQSGLFTSMQRMVMAPFVAAKTVEKTHDLVEELGKTNEEASKCINALEGCAEEVERAARTIGDIADTSKSFLDYICETFASVKTAISKHLPDLLVKCILAAFLYYLLVKIDIPIFRTVFLGVVGFVLGQEAAKLFIDYFYVDDKLDEQILTQSGGDSSVYAQLIATLILGAIFAGKQPSGFSSLFSAVNSSVSSAPRTIKGVESIFDMVIGVVETVVNTIRKWMGAAPVRLIHKWKTELGDLVERVHLAEYEEASGNCKLSPPERYTRMLALLREVQVQMATHTAHREIKTVLNDLHRILVRISAPLRATHGEGVGYRVQPASLILSGKPGVGKTNMTQMIALTAMRMTGDLPPNPTPQEAAQSIFTKPENSPYMDGYNGQYCYLIDDLFAILPQPNSQSTQFADIMTYYGSFTAQLDMAACESKGMFPFTSKLILMTTNCKDLDEVRASQILLCPEAFNRRIDFHYEICVKPEYRKHNSHELCFEKFKQEEMKMSRDTLLTSYPWHIWECFPTRFGNHNEGIPGQGISISEVLISVANRIKLNKKYHASTMDTFQTILSAPLDKVLQQSGEIEEYPYSCDEEIPELVQDDFEDCDEPNFTLPGFVPDSDSEDEGAEEAPSHKYSDMHCKMTHHTKCAQNAAEAAIESDLFEEPGVAAETARSYEMYRAGVGDALKGIESGFADNIWAWTALTAFCALFYYGAFKIFKQFAKFISGLVKGIYDWIRDLFYPSSDTTEEQSNGPQGRVVRFKTQLQAGEIEEKSTPPLWEVVYENTYKLAIKYSSEKYGVLGQILFLKACVAVMPMHFFDDIIEKMRLGTVTSDTELLLRGCAKNNHNIHIKVSTFLALSRKEYKNRDLVFVDFGRAIAPRRNITKFILTKYEIDNIGSRAVRLDTARMSKDGHLIEYNERTTFFAPSVEVGKVTKTIGFTDHEHWLRYAALTERGDCGAVLTVTDHSPFACRLIAGIHVGFQPSVGKAYATMLDSDLCKEALATFKTFCPKEMSFNETIQQAGGDLADRFNSKPTTVLPFGDGTFGSFEPLAKLSEPVSNPVRTSLQSTVLNKEFDEEIKDFYNGAEVPKMYPVKLGSYEDEEGIVIFPMEKAMEPFAGDTLIVDTKQFKKAVMTALSPFNKASVHSVARKLTFEEAVLGVPALGLKSITRKTSVGYPHCVLMSNKTGFLGTGDEFDLTTEAALQLKREVLALEEAIIGGRRPFFIARDFLKDEVRKIGKNARLIAGTDIRYYILCRMYFGAFVAALVNHHQSSGTCVGMNPYSEWGWLREFLTKHGACLWDGDFAGFDSLQQPGMLWCICEAINSWYSQRGNGEDNQSRDILFYDLAHSRHLAAAHGQADTVFQWQKSLPSGHFLTATVNSILSMGCIVSAGITTTGDEDFWSYASVATLGDDNVVNAADSHVHLFNQVTTAAHVKSHYGMEYTAGRKGEELKPYMGIEDVIFLQRQFRKKNGLDVCPIRPESFLTSLYYSKKGTVEYRKEVMATGLESALEELSMHTEEFWNKVSPKIIAAMSMIDEAPQLDITSSEAYLERVLTRVPLWV